MYKSFLFLKRSRAAKTLPTPSGPKGSSGNSCLLGARFLSQGHAQACPCFFIPNRNSFMGNSAILLAVQSAFWFSLANTLVRLVGSNLPSMEITLGRSLVGLALCAFAFRKTGFDFGTNKKLLLTRGIVGFISLFCTIYAVTHLPLADAITLFYTNPVFSLLLGIFFLKERPEAKAMLCIVISMTGVLLITRPSFLFSGTSLDTFGTCVALTAALFSAAAYVTMHAIGKTENPVTTIAYLYLVSAPAAFLFSLPNWVWPSAQDMLFLLGIGGLTQLGQVCLVKALCLEQAGTVTAISTIQVAFVTAIGILFFHEHPVFLSACGTVLIVASAIILNLRQ